MHADYITFDQALYDAGIAMRTQAPRQQLSEVEAGCLDWHFVWPCAEALSIDFSMVYQSSVENAWVWACAVAHQLLPVTLLVDEEGSTAELCAQWHDEPGDVLCLTLRKRQGGPAEKNGLEFARASWVQGRSHFLRRLGYLFDKRLNTTEYRPREWMYPSPLWLPLAGVLPWHWPGRVSEYDLRSPWSPQQQRAWFWLLLATALCVTKPNQAFGIPGEIRARLETSEMNLRHAALCAAWREMGEPEPTELSKESKNLHSALCDRFEEVDDFYDNLRWTRISDAKLAPIDPQGLETWHASQPIRHLFHDDLKALTDRAQRWFPLDCGVWLRDAFMHAGQILDQREEHWRWEREGKVYGRKAQSSIDHRMRFFIVDWGRYGITREMGLLGTWQPNGWRWPVLETTVGDFKPGSGEPYARWREFAMDATTANCLAICPCCGYPHLDDERCEIHDCPVCGWDMFGEASTRQADPDDSVGSREGEPTLAQARGYFAAHGDAYPADDLEHTTWLRRPDILRLRCLVRAELDAWLREPPPRPPLPEATWEALNWSARSHWIPYEDDPDTGPYSPWPREGN